RRRHKRCRAPPSRPFPTRWSSPFQKWQTRCAPGWHNEEYMLEKVNVLAVDDIEENLVALAALLNRPQLELIRARSGTEALEALLARDIALALIDVQMPVMEGFEMAELMRGSERTKHVPIIFHTEGAP